MKENKGSRKQKGAMATIGLLILTKLKWLLVTLKVFKFGGTLISLVLSLVTYAVLFGWQFAIALIYVLFVHEMGHLVAARIKGIKTTPAIFIPFMGALIGMKERPKDAATEAYVAYGGPLFGLFSTLPPLILFQLTHQPIWGVTVLVGAMLNLFNLIPVSPLDGGRIIGVLSPYLWLLGLIGIGVFTYFFPSPLLIIIIILGVLSVWSRLRENFQISRLTIEIELREEMKRDMASIWNDLFYQSYQYGEERLVNDVMKMHFLREWDRTRKAIYNKARSLDGFKLPILHDKQKLNNYRFISKAEKYSQMMKWLEGVQNWEDITYFHQELDRDIRRLKSERLAINQYYNATAKTKWITFGFYLLLAAALGLLFFYAQSIVPGSIY
ncbi:site-2 protease family protein [Pullulanibacillus sp. KACC 23026]|uniref:site-2 protease family protein n=1 Tax=Pullulanibacillus sp. KACC 23026 TaxID=3028315 RepID=UPI0023AE7F61|nr:site-2 protease family protein [Pullulanibacillus sp. KACC 23026]WEG12538.1 site-2 protease family protein [Pullulanibacillus sp. KACC 23026]